MRPLKEANKAAEDDVVVSTVNGEDREASMARLRAHLLDQQSQLD
jgi:hypothetical protein